MPTDRIMQHRCRAAIQVVIDDLGSWRFYTPTWKPISHCYRCLARLTRRSLLSLDRDVRSEEGRR